MTMNVEQADSSEHGNGGAVNRPLLDQIESEALDGDVVKALRLCIKLGGHSGSDPLREWASRELNGYGDSDGPEDTVWPPAYRRIQAPLCVDAMKPGQSVAGLPIPLDFLPDSARELAKDGLLLTKPISELRDMAQNVEPLKLTPVWSFNGIAHMNQMGYTNEAYRLYWAPHQSAINTVVERVRTNLVRLVNEMRPNLESGQDLPTTEVASQAVSMVISGNNNSLTMGNIEQTAQSTKPDKPPARRKLEIAGWVATIISTIAALVFGLIYLLA